MQLCIIIDVSGKCAFLAGRKVAPSVSSPILAIINLSILILVFKTHTISNLFKISLVFVVENFNYSNSPAITPLSSPA